MKLVLFLMIVFTFSSVSKAAWVMPVENLTCTTDINEWGKNASCDCPEANAYNAKIGRCTVGERYPIMVSGSIRSKDAETKGVYIDTQVGSFQLVVKTAELKKLARVNGLYFEVEGEFFLLEKEPVIIVDYLRRLE